MPTEKPGELDEDGRGGEAPGVKNRQGAEEEEAEQPDAQVGERGAEVFKQAVAGWAVGLGGRESRLEPDAFRFGKPRSI